MKIKDKRTSLAIVVNSSTNIADVFIVPPSAFENDSGEFVCNLEKCEKVIVNDATNFMFSLPTGYRIAVLTGGVFETIYKKNNDDSATMRIPNSDATDDVDVMAEPVGCGDIVIATIKEE